VLRDYLPTGNQTGTFLEIPPDAPVTITAKPAEDRNGIIVRLQNLTEAAITVPLKITAAHPQTAVATSPLEIDGETLARSGSTITVPVAARVVQSIRITF